MHPVFLALKSCTIAEPRKAPSMMAYWLYGLVLLKIEKLYHAYQAMEGACSCQSLECKPPSH